MIHVQVLLFVEDISIHCGGCGRECQRRFHDAERSAGKGAVEVVHRCSRKGRLFVEQHKAGQVEFLTKHVIHGDFRSMQSWKAGEERERECERRFTLWMAQGREFWFLLVMLFLLEKSTSQNSGHIP